jgi:hypothetical protein
MVVVIESQGKKGKKRKDLERREALPKTQQREREKMQLK